VEVAFLAKRGKMTIPEALERMKAAGVDSMPGGGAEIFADRVRPYYLRHHKIDGSEWLDRRGRRIRLGCGRTPRCCMGMWRMMRTASHLVKLREVQDETGGFQTFIPLAFHPENTALAHIPKTTGMLDLRQIAVGRLMLDNFRTSRATGRWCRRRWRRFRWVGADDIDGTVIEEKIYHDAGATTPQGMRRADLVRLITEAGREPFERDTMYRAVTRSEDSFTVAV